MAEVNEEKHLVPMRETDDISLILYKRAKDQEKHLADTIKKERQTREKLWKVKERYNVSRNKIGHILQRKDEITQRLHSKEAKIRKANERILVLERFVENCKLFIEKGNVFEEKIKETQEMITQIIVKEYENEQKLVVVYRRKDNLERIISRHHEKHNAAKEQYNNKRKQYKETVAFYQEIRGNIQNSIERAKTAYEKCIETAPKLLEVQKKVRLLEASVYGLEMKINAREDEIKQTKKDRKYKKQEYDRMKIEQMVRLDKKMRKLKFK